MNSLDNMLVFNAGIKNSAKIVYSEPCQSGAKAHKESLLYQRHWMYFKAIGIIILAFFILYPQPLASVKLRQIDYVSMFLSGEAPFIGAMAPEARANKTLTKQDFYPKYLAQQAHPDHLRINGQAKQDAPFSKLGYNKLQKAAGNLSVRSSVGLGAGVPKEEHIAKISKIFAINKSGYKPSQFAQITPVIRRQAIPVLADIAPLISNNQIDSLALAYVAPSSKAAPSPFDAILNESEKQYRFIPPIGANDHAWAATPLPAWVFSAKEQQCLAEAIYFEARGESIKGQAAVAQVVLNRVRNPAYPDSVCEVVYQNKQKPNQCQFSFACDGKAHFVTEPKQWQIARAIATAVSAGQIWLPHIGSATHYHALYVAPRWASAMDRVEKIGLHVFYRTKNGGWS